MATYDSYLKQVYPEPPITAYKRQQNIKDKVIRAKLPPNNCIHQKRKLKGMKKCNKPCHACPFIKEGKEIKTDNYKWTINSLANCRSHNIIYVINCEKENSHKKYIGETERKL